MYVEYEQFDIVEVAKKCGILFHSAPKNNVEYKARCPFCGDRKYHLGLNRQKGMFHCFKCKEKGNSVSLYAKLNGISNREAYARLKNDDYDFKIREITYVENYQTPIRSLYDRHNVYYDFLKLLRLNNHHRENLLGRGLPLNRIYQFMYRSMPLDDVFRREVLEKLSRKYDLTGIPGFYRDRSGDWQMYIQKYGGLFIPVCNKEGYIQGLQIRLDLPDDSDEDKFRWFSSKYYHCGTRAKPWVHVVGNTNAKEACITEGAMKADITSVLANGQLFIAVPGVNSINQLVGVIKDMKLERVYEAFDMDKRSKPEVKEALINLRKVLTESGIEYEGCSWNPDFNGVDDYFVAKTNYLQTMAMPMAA